MRATNQSYLTQHWLTSWMSSSPKLKWRYFIVYTQNISIFQWQYRPRYCCSFTWWLKQTGLTQIMFEVFNSLISYAIRHSEWQEITLARGFWCLNLCIYDIRELASAKPTNESTVSMNLNQWEWPVWTSSNSDLFQDRKPDTSFQLEWSSLIGRDTSRYCALIG